MMVSKQNTGNQENQIKQKSQLKQKKHSLSEYAEGIATDPLVIGGQIFYSRLLLGTGKYGQLNTMESAIKASGTNMVTVALRRIEAKLPAKDNRDQLSNLTKKRERVKERENETEKSLLEYIPREIRQANGQNEPVFLMPNTSGARTAKEAVLAAELSRDMMGTDFIKLEIHPDPTHLMPDPVETLLAAETLVKKGFIVLPYVHADPVLCKRLEQVGVAAVMPLGAPIGSNMGLSSRIFLEIIIENSMVPVIIDAGIGRPSDAALAMEMGADAVLISTAIATAKDPVGMAAAFKLAVASGRKARLAGLGGKGLLGAATSPLTDFLC